MTERQAVRWMESAAGRWEKRLTRAREGRLLPWAGLSLALWRLGKGKTLAAGLGLALWCLGKGKTLAAGLGLALWCLGKGKTLAARLAAFLLAGGLTALLGRVRP